METSPLVLNERFSFILDKEKESLVKFKMYIHFLKYLIDFWQFSNF